MPKVTAVMATYNWSTVLPYSIGSALGQTFTDFELLVVGDGCTDDSERVVSEIGDPRVRWINLQPRHGHQSGPNNEGIRQARGRYVAYLGHDDLWLPRHLELLVQALDAGADIAHTTLAVVKTNGELEPGTYPPTSLAHRRTMLEPIGGWPNYRDITVLPEEHLWNFVRREHLKSTFVRRCTAVKVPAAWRRDVYRERPCHEQAAWLERIRAEPDLETTLLVDMAFGLAKKNVPPLWVRVPRLLLRPWRWPAAIMRRIPRKGAWIQRMRRLKGVTD